MNYEELKKCQEIKKIDAKIENIQRWHTDNKIPYSCEEKQELENLEDKYCQLLNI